MFKSSLVLASALALVSSSALSAVSAEEAKQLGGLILTAWGAEKAGNKEGTIPAYSGEKINIPSGWDRKKQGYPDPWDEKPLYSITSQNADKYADKLDGMLELFKKYPNFRMDIYPTHRTVNYPKSVLEGTARNATSCKGANEEMKLTTDCYAGIPFPIPKTGRQAMWNKLLHFGTYSYQTDGVSSWVVPPSGAPILQSESEMFMEYPLYSPEKIGKPLRANDIFFQARVDNTGPARAAGLKYVFTYSIDPDIGNRTWQYVPGQRRVKLAPDLAYDTPSPISGGASLMDEQLGFLGAMDRFEYKLAGKKEKFILYNNQKLSDPRACPNPMLTSTKHFPNPDCGRWELHRVWIVKAELRPGYRHAYKNRMYFIDEDTAAAGSTEGYDHAGKLYRIVNTIHFASYEGGYFSAGLQEMDLLSGIWMTTGGGYGVDGGAYYPAAPKGKFFYTPEALAGEGIR